MSDVYALIDAGTFSSGPLIHCLSTAQETARVPLPPRSHHLAAESLLITRSSAGLVHHNPTYANFFVFFISGYLFPVFYVV